MTNANELELYMLELINEERTSRGLNALQLEMNLNQSAENHSGWMLDSNVFSHTGVGDSSATQRMQDAGFDLSGSWETAENIAIQSSRGVDGFLDDTADLHTSLMNSPGHRANLLNPDLVYIGIGIEIGTFTYSNGYTGQSVIVTQNFGRTQGDVDLDTGAAVDVPTFEGSSSADFFVGTADIDDIYGLGGNDVLFGGAGDDLVDGGAGNDVLIGGAGADELIGGAGQDRAQYSGASAAIVADLQLERLNTGEAEGDSYSAVENLLGSVYGDVLRGDGGENTIWGHSGDDQIIGRGGDDVLFGQMGNDTLYGQIGDDTLNGNNGNDVLIGGAGADVLNGDAGLDSANYSDASATVFADLQMSSFNRGDAAGDTYISIERVVGSSLGDSLRGDAGANVLWGMNGNDQLYGRAGNDRLLGMAGDDALYGMSGNDLLIGHGGDDRLAGGSGHDTFLFHNGFGNDTITDFNASLSGEYISLANVTAITDFNDLDANHLRQTGNNAEIFDSNGNSITLLGVQADDLTAGDFLF